MRSFIYRHRTRRLLIVVVLLSAVGFFYLYEPRWIKRTVEDKVAEFMGNELTARIGEVRGGMFRDMILQNVAIYSGKGDEGGVFRVERMEIPYRIWRALFDKLGLLPPQERDLRNIGIYFSRENPFIKGFIKLYKYPDRIELFGHISPGIFGDREKRGVKGVFRKRGDGRYDCEILWDGKTKITGTLDPSGRTIDLGFTPVARKKGIVKIKGSIGEKKEVKVYSRLDKVSVFGTEVIGDLWLTYRDPGIPVFFFKAENLVIDKRPFWDVVVEGEFSPGEKKLSLDNVKWGESITLRGKIRTQDPYPAELRLVIKDMDLGELAGMLGNTTGPFAGVAETDINIEGPVKTAEVKGRLFISEGVMNNMEFRSIFATLEGKLPVVRIVDSRVLKETGHLIVSGQMDFSKLRENKAFEDVVFETDNRVAVWEDWQISKEEKHHVVEARKDKVTISTSMDDGSLRRRPVTEDAIQKEFGFKYGLDGSNSIKIETSEEDDFFGLEHKIQF
ncbi:MAG: hypothetical protein U9R44_07020 [Candidatus Omnitrophota bacterium]|nr:hypothetical protein [Candidatus Omnitrophota bacterium]